MTTTVQEYVKGKPPIVTTTLNDALVVVSKRMIEHDFSQLPVVDSENKPIGIVTSDSILRSLSNFKTNLESMRVKHVVQKTPRIFKQDIDLLDLFDDMDGSFVGIIVDDEEKLVQIITNFDTAEYFQQRANDILLVENIESIIKDYVQQAFDALPNGEARLAQAIQSMTNSVIAQRVTFEKGVRRYLNTLPEETKIPVDKEHLAQIAEKYFNDSQPSVGFDELTLGHYISLLLLKEFWPDFETIFEVPKVAIINLLEEVRITRNDLAHFREISRDQSDQLRFCYDLLISHQKAVDNLFSSDDSDETEDSLAIEAEQENIEEIQPVADEPEPGDSKYAPLAIWLQSQPREKDVISLTFSRIEEIIGGELPASAYKNRAWWANDSVGHVQSKQWLDVGWRVAAAHMSKRNIRFARIKERDKAYIDFYSALITKLRKENGFQSLNVYPDGASWHWIKGISLKGISLAGIHYAFGRGKTFRVEFYFDTGDQETNKFIFDGLNKQKMVIEENLGVNLTWQRLDNKRASRIAQTFDGHITDDWDDLLKLQEKVIPATLKFVDEMEPRVVALGEEFIEAKSN